MVHSFALLGPGTGGDAGEMGGVGVLMELQEYRAQALQGAAGRASEQARAQASNLTIYLKLTGRGRGARREGLRDVATQFPGGRTRSRLHSGAGTASIEAWTPALTSSAASVWAPSHHLELLTAPPEDPRPPLRWSGEGIHASSYRRPLGSRLPGLTLKPRWGWDLLQMR